MSAAWQRVVELASRQHGVIARRQMADLGISTRAVEWWRRDGRLVPLHRGVYAIGRPQLTREGRWLAAVLAVGADAVLSHLSAAVLWGMLDVDPAVVDVSARSQRHRHDGIRTHSTLHLPRRDVRIENRIPVTSPERTFLDIAAMVGERRLRGALRVAEREHLFDAPGLLSALPAQRGRPGIAAARRILGRYAGIAGRFRSGLEIDFWDLLQTGRAGRCPRSTCTSVATRPTSSGAS